MLKDLVSRVDWKPDGRTAGDRSPEWLRNLHGAQASRGRSWQSRWLLAGLFLLCTIALANPLQAAQDESKVLREQAKKYWEARVKGDWATVYDCLPEDQRAGQTKEEFVETSKQRGPWRYLTYKMGGVETADDMGWVKVEYSAEPVMFPGIKPTDANAWEIWEKLDGKWLPVFGKRTEEFPQLPPSLRPAKEEKAVRALADQFWKARVKNDYRTVYKLCDPTFRSAVSVDEWLEKKAQNIYLQYRILWVEAFEDRAVVKVAFEYRPDDPSVTKMDPQEGITMQRWVKVDGQWYFSISE